jgi:hypothetical protein
MKFFNREFKEGMPISVRGFARGIMAMARALGEMRGIGCHLEWSGMGIPTIVIDQPTPTGSDDLSQPFDVAFDGADCTFSMCAYERQGITRLLEDLTHTVTGADGYYYLSLKIPMVTGSVTIHQAATFSAAVKTELDESETYYYKLLYEVHKKTTGGVVSVSVTQDWRNIPQVVLAI